MKDIIKKVVEVHVIFWGVSIVLYLVISFIFWDIVPIAWALIRIIEVFIIFMSLVLKRVNKNVIL